MNDNQLIIKDQEQSPPLIELTELNLITSNNQEQLKDLLTSFYKDYSQKLQDIKLALQDNQLITVQREAHKIAGSAQMIGAKSLQSASLTLNYSLKEGHIDVTKSEYFLDILEQTLKALDKQISSMH
ncbi:MAG: Hpt domain-containing protein [Methylococcales bacterium]